MFWHKMTLKVINVLALLGLRCLGTYRLVGDTSVFKTDKKPVELAESATVALRTGIDDISVFGAP